ncbi:MAG: ABC transporter ATP-binding protein [Blastocatellia bacterium]
MSILNLDKVRKRYDGGETPVEAVRGVTMRLERGDFVALMGPSGCGKSTLLHLCGAMDRPTEGELSIAGTDIRQLGDDQLTLLRRERLGFVFQFFNLLPTLTVLENIELPLLLGGASAVESERRARELAERVGLGHRAHHYPPQISGGEMQRAAIARAVIHQPVLLIADEPTGNLDSENGAIILALLRDLNRDLGLTILMATHSTETAAIAGRLLMMRDGALLAGQ